MAVELDITICKIYLTVFEDLIVATQGGYLPDPPVCYTILHVPLHPSNAITIAE